jgi:hypothetical protein
MIQIILDRIGEDEEQTYGVLKIGGRPRFVTCEDKWRKNQRNVSCIPCGRYICIEHDSPKFGWTYLVTDVPGRSHILFHAGNTHVDTRGCILVGSSFNHVPGRAGIVSSRAAFGHFIQLLRDVASFELVVRDLMACHPKET